MNSIPGRDDVRIMTLQAHILAEQDRHAHAGTLSWILSALSISAKIIADKVRRARLENVLGSVGTENIQGETQQKLDVLANEVLMGALGGREGVAIVASEENEEPIMLREDDGRGVSRYCVLFDPLDGSSNLDVCGGVGTIFSILALDGKQPRAAQSLLQPGSRQIAAGYVLYGSSTVFVLTLGSGVDMFVLDPGIGAFMRVERGLEDPCRLQDLFGERGEPTELSGRLSPLPRLGAEQRLFKPLLRRHGRRRASHLAERRRVPLSADAQGAAGEAAAHVRGQPHGHARRASRR